MLNRRGFLTSGLLAGATSLSPAFAHTKHKKGKTRKRYVLPKKYLPREVRLWRKNYKAGEIHVFPDEFAMYWTLPRGKAIRYSVGVGRGNLYHSGTFFVGEKKKWPEWTPTADMIKRDPKSYAKFAGGMPGGIRNPLGARALYLFTKKQGDTFLRIHGTNNPRTIGIAVSNGCARLVNEQIVEFYDKVPMNTKVVLHPKKGFSKAHA